MNVSPTQQDHLCAAVTLMLRALGHDTNREGLKDTPERVAKFMQAWHSPEPFEFTSFDSEGMDEMVVQVGIPFFSLCEHHMLPFFGTAAVAYIPGKRIVGLSKLARCVQHYARGLQNQERITTKVAEALQDALQPAGVGVVLRARHLCMEMRGARAHNTETTTSSLRGVIHDDPRTRSEFLLLAKT